MGMDEAAIHTARLTLRPLTIEQLRAYLVDPSRLEAELLADLSRAILSPVLERAIRMKIERMGASPAGEHLWLTYWLIHINAYAYGAGTIGFKGAQDIGGVVEVGYGIDPRFQGRGYMTEASEGLLKWVFQQAACQAVVAPDTRLDNSASNCLLQKVGMRTYAQDEETISWRLDRGTFEGRHSRMGAHETGAHDRSASLGAGGS